MNERKKVLETVSIPLPEGVRVEYEGVVLRVSGEHGQVERELFHPGVKIEVKNNSITVTSAKYDKKKKRIAHTIIAHMRNMLNGVKKPYVYELKVCSGHFPMSLKVEKTEVVISNFLGEKVSRRSKILDGVKVNVQGDHVVMEGVDLERVGQSAANLEIATKIKGRDRRIFQDGCFITKKPE